MPSYAALQSAMSRIVFLWLRCLICCVIIACLFVFCLFVSNITIGNGFDFFDRGQPMQGKPMQLQCFASFICLSVLILHFTAIINATCSICCCYCCCCCVLFKSQKCLFVYNSQLRLPLSMCILYNQRDATYTMFFIIISALHVLGWSSNPSTPAVDGRKARQYPRLHIQFYKLLMMGGTPPKT